MVTLKSLSPRNPSQPLFLKAGCESVSRIQSKQTGEGEAGGGIKVTLFVRMFVFFCALARGTEDQAEKPTEYSFSLTRTHYNTLTVTAG